MQPPKALLLDLDGVLYVGDQLISGAKEAIQFLRDRHIPFRIVTNTTTRTRASLADKVSAMGLQLSPEEIISAAYAGVLHLRSLDNPNCRLVMDDNTKRDFAEFEQDNHSPDVIVLGDHNDWDYPLLNSLFNQIMNGAKMVALHKGRYWQVEDGLRVDLGLFIAGLEYVTGKTATVIGKPSEQFFRLALSDIDTDPADAMMIGDDIVNDVNGAQRAGLRGVLVKTGKYRPGYENTSDTPPDAVIESIAELPTLFG